jgi:hypothetical protein
MPYKPTEKVHCKGCGGWVAEVDRRTGRVVRVRNANKVPPPERPDWDTLDEHDGNGAIVALSDETPAYGRAWCAKCKVFVEWPLGYPHLQNPTV